MTNITRTFLRTEGMMTKYMEVMKEREAKGIKYNPFTSNSEIVVKEFRYWNIIENEFPYDAVATTTHMIATKREVPFDWSLLNEEEKIEFEKIKKEYIAEHYDAIWENLPKGQTISKHFHLNLLVLKREVI